MRSYAVVSCLFLQCLIFCPTVGQSQATGQEAEAIFNGKDLTGWRGNLELWSVQDGCITGRTTDEQPIQFNTFLIWDGEVADFELELDYKIGSAGNSGIQYRSQILDKDKFIVGGYQADIDATMKYAGINYEEKGRGILAQRGTRVILKPGKEKGIEEFGDAEQLGKEIHAEEWNHYRIVARGNKLSHFINDHLTSEVIDEDTEHAASKGVLAFQVHRGPAMVIQFKNIKLRQIK